MKKIFFALLVIFTTLFFVSCQKSTDSPSSPADIKGTWTFVSMSATTNTTAEATQSGESNKSVTTSSYTTENNTGTMTIDASTMTSNNISYTVNTTAKAYMYKTTFSSIVLRFLLILLRLHPQAALTTGLLQVTQFILTRGVYL